MSEATLVYPHQLFYSSPSLSTDHPVYLIEEPLLLTHNPIHRSKLLLHKLSLDAYQAHLTKQKYHVIRLTIHDHPTTNHVFRRIEADGIKTIHVVDTSDAYLEAAIEKTKLERVWYESPLFILKKNDAVNRYSATGKHMARFYTAMRKDLGLLVDSKGKPQGGKWSFDAENRKRIPKEVTLPKDLQTYNDQVVTTAQSWVTSVPAETYGDCVIWLPYTHESARSYLHTFLTERFENFGTYEDALHTDHTQLWHSTLSPLMNIGLLTPREVITAAVEHAKTFDIPLNSLEGFIRQIIGWREFMRASYECDGSAMRTCNFFNHTTQLPRSFWTGTTGLTPVDYAINTALRFGYTHHIERLMVLGNSMLLCQIDPDEVYRWFMAMYIDAYDWVMVPNVYGMSQFADGGSFATKPYISGANYLKKMGTYPKGDWEEIWTALYWHFIHVHHDTFVANPRMSMMTRLLAKMEPKKRRQYTYAANSFLKKLS